MYHMLPFAYRPEIKASRRQHGAFQNMVAELVERVLLETEIVDIDNPIGSKLFNSIDRFFSYGLLTADKAYWRCVQQYIPRAEKEMLIAECGNANDRYLSIGWLKTAFNKGTLHFYMLSLNNKDNKHYLTRFYHENACIRNSGLLEAITGFVEKFQHVQFAFYSTRQLRIEPAPAVVIETAPVTLSLRAAARQRKMTECEMPNETVKNVLPTEVPAILTSAVDQEVLLDELVRNRRNRLYSEQVNAQKAAYEEENCSEQIEIPVVEERLEDVLVKTMSAINMDLNAATPLEDVLLQEPFEDEEHHFKLSEGEFQLPQGDIFNLAMNYYEKHSERIKESFTIFENFHGDAKKLRFFIMTNFNVYILKQNDDAQNENGNTSPSPVAGSRYSPILRLPHDRIECIQMGIDNLSFSLVSKDGGFFVYDTASGECEEQEMSYSASICSHDAGVRMLNALMQVTNFSDRDQKIDLHVDDREAYMILLQPSLTKQVGPVKINSGILCYWLEQSAHDEQAVDTVSGYLYKKTISGMSNWLLKNQAEQEQKYCMISGKKMYVFVDSTCKEGEQVFDLTECEYVQEGRNNFILKSSQGSFEFESTDKEGFSEWLGCISSAIEDAGLPTYLTPALNIITDEGFFILQEGEKFWTDGFIRFLHKIEKSTIQECILVYPSEEKVMFGNKQSAICVRTTKDELHYFFVRFASEINRIAIIIRDRFQGIPVVTLDTEMAKTPLGKKIHDTCCSVLNLWKEVLVMDNNLAEPVEEIPFDVDMDSNDEDNVNEFNYEDHYGDDIEVDESGSSDHSEPKKKRSKLLNLPADRLPERYVQEFEGGEEMYEKCEHSYMKIKKRTLHVVESREKPKIPSVIQLNMENRRVTTNIDCNKYYMKVPQKHKPYVTKTRIVPAGYAPFKASKTQRRNVSAYINQKIRTKQDRKLAKRLEFERRTERQKKLEEEEVKRGQNIEDLRNKLLDLDKQKHDLFISLKACLQQENFYKQVLEEENRRLAVIEFFRNENIDSNQGTSSSSLIQKDQCGKSRNEMIAQYNDLLGKVIEEKGIEIARLEAQLAVDQARLTELMNKFGPVVMTEDELRSKIRKLKESECDDRDEDTLFELLKNCVQIKENPEPSETLDEVQRHTIFDDLKHWHQNYTSGQMQGEQRKLFIRSIFCNPLNCFTYKIRGNVPSNIEDYVLINQFCEEADPWFPESIDSNNTQATIQKTLDYITERLAKDLITVSERVFVDELKDSLKTILEIMSSQAEQKVDDTSNLVEEHQGTSDSLENILEKDLIPNIKREEPSESVERKGFPFVCVKKEPSDSPAAFSMALQKDIARDADDSQLFEQEKEESILNQSNVSQPMKEVLPVEDQNVVNQSDVLGTMQKIKQELLEEELLNVENDPTYVRPTETPNSAYLLDDNDDDILIDEQPNIPQQVNLQPAVEQQDDISDDVLIDVENSFVEEEEQPTTSQPVCALPPVFDQAQLIQQQQQEMIKQQMELQKQQQEAFLLQELQKQQMQYRQQQEIHKRQQQEIQNQMTMLQAQEQLRAITQQQIPIVAPPMMTIQSQMMQMQRPMFPIMPQVYPTQFINPFPNEIQYIGAFGPAFGMNPTGFQPALFTPRPLDREIKQEVITPPPNDQM
ncbi:unnamed protein product [Caenorhabditis angaria]|uniref:PH domain-containing protein n=1 Tax=Caenorhabditis angaria TaxID=860376 RepID=A0A9P1NAQ5_9PELO|nr:unnamed protein product [Caenorhabditis angaria]